jgi:hypothetical protein
MRGTKPRNFGSQVRSIEDRFNEWVDTPTGREIYREFGRVAKKLKKAGHRRYSHCAIVEVIRYHRVVESNMSDVHISNDFRSRLVRKFLRENPDFEGFFTLRELQTA